MAGELNEFRQSGAHTPIYSVNLAYASVNVWVHFGSILGPFWVHFDDFLNIDASLGFQSVFRQESAFGQESVFRQEFSSDKNISLAC